MTNYEESAKAYESDYKFAPVGMAVGSFWGGALIAGLVAFAMSCGIAKGIVPMTIHDGQRTLFADDNKGLYLGIAIAGILLTLSILVGLAGLAAVSKKRDLGGLWKASLIGIPILALLGTFFGIVFFH